MADDIRAVWLVWDQGVLVGIYSSEYVAKLHVQRHIEIALKDYREFSGSYLDSEAKHLALIESGIVLSERRVIDEGPLAVPLK